MKQIRLGTLFSGIGAIEQAFSKQNIPFNIVFACDNGERLLPLSKEKIDELLKNKSFDDKQFIVKNLYDKTGKTNWVKMTYVANYKISEKDWFEDIRFLDGSHYKNKVDIIVGGSPCQSFSISGKRLGLEDARGTLFYDYARIIKETKPKVFIYENVPGILSHDKGNTFKVITSIFDSLGYDWSYSKLLATDFGIPQHRERLFVVGFRNDLSIKPFEFPHPIKLSTTMKDFLDKEVDHKYYHGEKGFKWVTKPKSLEKRVSINSKICRTQTANQQFNWCGDMVFRKIEETPWAVDDKKIYVGNYKNEEGVIRKLTPRECLRLMGFSENFKIVVPDNKMYRQCGNSIVVNVLEELLKSIILTGVFNGD